MCMQTQLLPILLEEKEKYLTMESLRRLHRAAQLDFEQTLKSLILMKANVENEATEEEERNISILMRSTMKTALDTIKLKEVLQN